MSKNSCFCSKVVAAGCTNLKTSHRLYWVRLIFPPSKAINTSISQYILYRIQYTEAEASTCILNVLSLLSSPKLKDFTRPFEDFPKVCSKLKAVFTLRLWCIFRGFTVTER